MIQSLQNNNIINIITLYLSFYALLQNKNKTISKVRQVVNNKMISNQKSSSVVSTIIDIHHVDCRDRFKKYKSIIENSKRQRLIDKIQHIFSHMTYKHIDVQSYMKDSPTAVQDRLSTIQSSFSESTENVSFDFGQSYISSSFITQSLKFPQQYPCSTTNQHIPSYLRQLNLLNSITPNFNHPQFNIKNQIKNLNKLIKIALEAINKVFSCALRIGNKDKKIKLFLESHVNKLNVKYFMNSGWQKIKYDQNIQDIKPKQNFTSNLELHQILSETELLLCKITRYELTISLIQQIDLQIYKNIRQATFQAQKKLLECSNSLYVLWNSFQYPDFYYKYLQILKDQHIYSQPGCSQEIEELIKQFRELWQLYQPVTCSEIGRLVWHKLNYLKREQKYNQLVIS